MDNQRPNVFPENTPNPNINQFAAQPSLEPNIPYDVIELPSKGLLYPSKKASVRVSYLTAADENILTSPNLIQSGKFLDVLMERKILDKDINPKDLLLGDRNAIMIWLRATGYGNMYPVIANDPETGDYFETEFDLNALKVKHLEVMPDEKNEFEFELPKSKQKVKFKLLTVREDDELTKKAEVYKKKGQPYTTALTDKMEKQICEINGERDLMKLRGMIQMLPAYDSLALRTYIDKIEPGIDMGISVEAPGGSLIESFLVIRPDFFWPNVRI